RRCRARNSAAPRPRPRGSCVRGWRDRRTRARGWRRSWCCGAFVQVYHRVMTEPVHQDGLLVACLCATWCKTCTEFRGTFDKLAIENAGAKFVWLDVEDDSALVGEIDIENFPTLAVFRGDRPLFYGVTMPQEGVVARTLSSLNQPDRDAIAVPVEIAGLTEVLSSRL